MESSNIQSGTFIDKSTWAEGEWLTEPDIVCWINEESGLPCLIVRTPLTGALCGYVGLPSIHPLNGKTEEAGEITNLKVHSGVTFTGADIAPEEYGICRPSYLDQTDGLWWIGFDTAHDEDFCPAILRSSMQLLSHQSYKNLNYVRSQVELLAHQLKYQGDTKMYS